MTAADDGRENGQPQDKSGSGSEVASAPPAADARPATRRTRVSWSFDPKLDDMITALVEIAPEYRLLRGRTYYKATVAAQLLEREIRRVVAKLPGDLQARFWARAKAVDGPAIDTYLEALP